MFTLVVVKTLKVLVYDLFAGHFFIQVIIRVKSTDFFPCPANVQH